MNENLKYIFATIGVLLLGGAYFLYVHQERLMGFFAPTVPEEVHVHADFALYINDEHVRFTDDRYQSAKNQVLHEDMHFHDNIDNVIHRHAEGITLGEFFSSLGVTLQNDCITLDSGETFCTDDTHVLKLYVNGGTIADIAGYIVQEEDQILLYYGLPNTETISAFEDTISDESCIYSGTCPERGVPPPESCGLTCDI